MKGQTDNINYIEVDNMQWFIESTKPNIGNHHQKC